MELLGRLQDRRRDLVDAYAAGLYPGGALAPSVVLPLATIQAAIAAVEAELARSKP